MNKNEHRLRNLENRMYGQTTECSIIFTTIDSNEYNINGKTYIKPSGITENTFYQQLEELKLISQKRVIFQTVKPDLGDEKLKI